MHLKGKKIAILVADGFEQSELVEPREALEEAGAETLLVGLGTEGEVEAWDGGDWGDHFEIDVALGSANVESFDALLIPGGVMSPDRLRMDERALRFVKGFVEMGKPVAAICHGPWLFVDSDLASGRTLTSYPSLKRDLMNAGAKWVDQEVVVDRGLVTSRNPDDIPAFNQKILQEFADTRPAQERPAYSLPTEANP